MDDRPRRSTNLCLFNRHFAFVLVSLLGKHTHVHLARRLVMIYTALGELINLIGKAIMAVMGT